MGAIFRREIGAYFTSGIAYIFLAVFWLFSGYFFYVAFAVYFVRLAAIGTFKI